MTVLEMTRGDTTTFDVTLTDGDGDPLDLTDLDLTFTASHAAMVITKTVGDGITVTDLAGGLASIELVPDDTADLEERMVLDWDLQVSDGTDVYTPLAGSLLVEMDVTP
jgi:hypothetical protein